MVVGIVLRLKAGSTMDRQRGHTHNTKDMGTCTLAAESAKLTM